MHSMAAWIGFKLCPCSAWHAPLKAPGDSQVARGRAIIPANRCHTGKLGEHDGVASIFALSGGMSAPCSTLIHAHSPLSHFHALTPVTLPHPHPCHTPHPHPSLPLAPIFVELEPMIIGKAVLWRCISKIRECRRSLKQVLSKSD